MPRILLAEDDEIMRITVEDRLRRENWTVDAVDDGLKAKKCLEHNNYHLVLSDIRMPGLSGVELLEQVRQLTPPPDIIMMTAYGSVDDAVSCMKKGAVDYILKPFNMDDLVIRIKRVLEMQSVKAKCASLEEHCLLTQKHIIGESPAIKKVYRIISQVAPTDSTVLVTGESGTGKELAAAAIHRSSTRATKPYVRINCAAIPEGLIESELFGHERGAFTGAHSRKPGKFELADGGTLLLDEIGDLPLPLQAKLLRVIQEGECERVGGTRTIKVDVRLICATAKDLGVEVKEGRFREDLYYRLRVIPVTMPPLRERREDIPILIDHFLAEFSQKRGITLKLSPEAMACMLEYDFPGNVRELKNIIERASVLAPNPVITPADLPADLHSGDDAAESFEGPVILSEALAQTEKRCLLSALARTGGNRTKAAELLGISRKNLWEKMKHYEITL